jgi:predicted metal-dependent peptidase
VFDPSLDKDGLLCEEEIYDLLLRDGGRIPKNTRPDLIINLTPEQTSAILGMVVQAVQAAEMAKQAGALPGNLKQVLNKFLEPVIDWRAVLNQFMTDLMDEGDYTWSRPSRRHEIYMPSIQKEEGNLDMELVYFQDTSGSISEEDMIRFNSEVRYVKEVLQPEKLTLVQFDMEIAYTKTFLKDEPFEDIEMHGGGGTDLHPVWEWIEKNRPKAAIIFSDLFCDPMRPLTVPVPVIWAVVHNEGAIVPFGKLIHIID